MLQYFYFIFQKTELKLENKEYKEIQRDVGDDVQYWNRTVGLYLVIEASNGVMLIWDKKTTVFIKLSPDYKVSAFFWSSIVNRQGNINLCTDD